MFDDMLQQNKSIIDAYAKMLDEASNTVTETGGKPLLEYHLRGTVNGKKFQIATDDVYAAADIKAQNPHLSDDEAKAIEAHTETDDFIDGGSSPSTQNGHHVVPHDNGGYFGDLSDTKSKLGV